MLKRDNIEMNRGQVIDYKLDRRDSRQRRQCLIIAPALAACAGALLLIAFDMQVAKLLVIATPAERAEQPIERPFGGAKAAAQKARLIQAPIFA